MADGGPRSTRSPHGRVAPGGGCCSHVASPQSLAAGPRAAGAAGLRRAHEREVPPAGQGSRLASRGHAVRRTRERTRACVTMLRVQFGTTEQVAAALARQGYLADRALATSVYLAAALEQPLLLEGEAGVGKTEVARALAQAIDARLIRLQCHEGIDLHHAVYDWDYQRQLLAIRAAEAGAEAGGLFGGELPLPPAPLKRRCLYHWIDYPSRDREAEIVHARLPDAPDAIVRRVCAAVARLRGEELYKVPGVGETITWARALLALDPEADLGDTLGVALKVREDLERVREKGVLQG